VRLKPKVDMVLEAAFCWIAIMMGVFVVLNRVFEFADVRQSSAVVTFVLLTILASWIWTRPTPK